MKFSSSTQFVFLVYLIDEILSNTSPISPLIIIGDQKLTHQYRPISTTISKLRIDGPFYSFVRWTSNQQSIDIYTDSNIHSYIEMEIENQTLHIRLPSIIDFKFTQMYLKLNLHLNIETIHLTGLTHLRSINMLSGMNQLKIVAEDTSSFHLYFDISSLEVHFLSAGSSVIQGQVRQQAILIYRGIADLDASKLICQRINLEANGLGIVSINGVDECLIKAEGVTTVKYHCNRVNHAQLTDLAKIIRI